MTNLEKGTAIVAATGVAFDLWVSFWLIVFQEDTRVTKTVTVIMVVILVYGLYCMYLGWRDQTS